MLSGGAAVPDHQDFFVSPGDAAGSMLRRLTEPTTILAAVSGGSDSIGLLIAFHQALAANSHSGHRLVAATVDHRLRPEAAAEAEDVARLCEAISIPHKILCWDGEKPKAGISAAAREVRYRLLMQAADTLDADVIVTGHTLDDQMETVAMRAARSEAAANLGLAGMAQAVLVDRSRWLLRPFLYTRRETIRDFLRQQGRGWADDPSNTDRHYERVRVRGAVVAGPAEPTEDIEAAGLRRTRLSEEATGICRRHLVLRHGVLAELAPEALNEPVDALRHLLGVLTAILGGRPHLPAASSMDRVMAMLEWRRRGRMTAGRVIFDLRRQGLFMHRESRDLPTVDLAIEEDAVWDSRYRVSNQSGRQAIIRPSVPDRKLATAMFADVPPAIAMRAMAVMPHVTQVPPITEMDKPSVIIAPILAPFDRFLPQFDLILGRELAELFGCSALPAAPIKVFERKS